MTDPNHPPLIQEHTLVLRTIPSSIPEAHRLRRLLKAALRAYGFKLVDYLAADVPVRQRTEVKR